MTLYAVIVGGVAFLAFLVWFYASAKSAGTSSAQGKEAQANVDAAKRIAEADARAPSTRDDLVDRLRQPGGGL